jgi:type IV pilus assembly protein PilE
MITGVRVRGVTLIELLIVVVVVAILGIFALPSYRQYVIRSQRTEAKNALIRLAANQERFYLQNNTYTTDLNALGFAGGVTEDGNYLLQVTGASTVQFDAIATPVADSPMIADVDCQSFGINQAGEQTAAPDPRGRCW